MNTSILRQVNIITKLPFPKLYLNKTKFQIENFKDNMGL